MLSFLKYRLAATEIQTWSRLPRAKAGLVQSWYKVGTLAGEKIWMPVQTERSHAGLARPEPEQHRDIGNGV